MDLCGCSDGRMRSPEDRGRDERDAVGGGEGKAAAVTDKGGEWSSWVAQTEPGLASAAEFRVLAKPGQRVFFALLEPG